MFLKLISRKKKKLKIKTVGTTSVWISCKDLKRASRRRLHPSDVAANSSCIKLISTESMYMWHLTACPGSNCTLQGVRLWEKKKQLGKDNSMLNVSLYSLFYRRWDEHYGVYKLAEQYRKIQFNHMKLFYSKTEKLHIGNAFNTEGQDPQLTSSSFHWTLPVYPSWRSAP